MQDQSVMNGISVTQWFDTIEAVRNQPELAKFQFRAQNNWLDGSQNRTQIKDFYGACQEDASRAEAFVLDADEPPILLGQDSAPSPVEFVLHALAACLTSALVYNAAANGVRLEEVESTLTGDLDAQGILQLRNDMPLGFQGITVNFRIKSDASAEQLESFMRLSPVLDIISTPTPVQLQIEVLETAGATPAAFTA